MRASAPCQLVRSQLLKTVKTPASHAITTHPHEYERLRAGRPRQCIEFVLQHLTSAMEANLYRFFGEIQATGCFARVHVFDFAAYENRTVGVRQRVHRLLQKRRGLVSESLLLWIRTGGFNRFHGSAFLRPSLREFPETLPLSQTARCLVNGDFGQPC